MGKRTTTLLFIAITLSSLLFCSCVNNISDNDSTDDLIPITLSTQIYLDKTRVAETNFEENDAIGLYVIIQPAALEGERHVDNTKFIYSASKGFIPESTEYFPDKESKYDFTSYYPYKKNAINANETTIEVSVKTSQTDWNSFSLSDFLVASTKNVTPTKNPVGLVFDHKLYKINLQIKPGDNYSLNDLLAADPIIKITDVYTKATYDFSTDKFTGHSSIADIIPYGTWKIEEGALTGKSVIVIPQSFNGTYAIIHIEINGKTFKVNLDSDYEFGSGSVEDFSITLSERISTSINPSINGWGTPVKKEITAEETSTSLFISIGDLTFLKSSIYHITSEGNPVAEICKEYLFANSVIDAQAIVAYPIKDGETDLKNGLVLKIIDESQDKHGGKVSWSNDNKLTYTAGSLSPVDRIFISTEGEITTTRPDDAKQLEIKEYTLTDTRGAETIIYPVTKIATQYWMASNLEATKYQNGNDIDEGDDFTEVSAKYCTEDGEYFFYNSTAISNASLNPVGWRISNETDWSKLQTYIADNASVLKKGSAWTNKPATNLTGFNAEVTGLYNETYRNTIYACYWCTSDTEPDNAIKSLALDVQDSNKINTSGNKNTLGLTIRCVRE